VPEPAATPTVLIPHLVTAGEPDDVRRAIAERLPEADLVVTNDRETTEEAVGDADVLVTSQLPAELLDAAGRLEWVHTLSAGVDSYDLDRLQSDGVVLTNSSGVHAEPIGEQVLGYLLLFERRIHRGIAQQRERTWERYGARELRYRTIGVVGVGAVGSRVAELCDAIAVDPRTLLNDLTAFFPHRLWAVESPDQYPGASTGGWGLAYGIGAPLGAPLAV
jgi:phosphoglycerate dehydrogenase-like enzyme